MQNNNADAVLQESRRSYFSPSLWVPALLILLACTAVIFEGYQVVQTLHRSAGQSARAQGQATAREIAGLLEREQERLQAFVAEKEAEILAIVSQSKSDNWPAIELLQSSLRRMFRGALAFSITDSKGKPVFEDFDGLVGPVCQTEMGNFASALQRGEQGPAIPPIHPMPDGYHFDLITPWKLGRDEIGLFFVSMSPERISELVDAAERASGNRVVLTSQTDPSLIEISSEGTRDKMSGAIRLAQDDLPTEAYTTDLPGTHWRLLVIPDGTELQAAIRKVYIRVGALVIGLLLLSALLLHLIRRAEQRDGSLFMRSLQSSVGRQRAILQSMVDGMVTINAQGRILHANKAVTALFGYSEKELLGNNVNMLMPEPDRSAHDGYLSHHIRTGESKILGSGREVIGRRKNGVVFPLLLTLGESYEGEERIFVGILHDMTAYNAAQRKIVAQAVEIKRSNQELDEISQIAANNLQNPLQRMASIGAALGSDHNSAVLSHAEQSELKMLADEARDASALVKGLADYTRVPSGIARKAVDLDRVLGDVQQDLAERIAKAGAEVLIAPLGQVTCDEKQLRQLFWNLFDNALKFRDPGRPFQLTVSRADHAVLPETGKLVIEVRDNGLGIPESELGRIFDAFHRLLPRNEFEGAGLGLSFCRRIVESAGGRISVTSQLGEGSVFQVVLPANQDGEHN